MSSKNLRGGPLRNKMEDLFQLLRASAATLRSALGSNQKVGNIPGCFSFKPGLLEITQVPEPLDETILPFPKGHSIAVRQAGAHSAPIRQWVPGVTSVAVHVHLHIGNASLEHGGQIFVCPHGVNAVAGSTTDNECRRSVAGNRRRGVARKWRRPWINQADKIRP